MNELQEQNNPKKQKKWYKELFMKHIDLSLNKYKHMQNKLNDSKTLQEAFNVVKEKITLTDIVIEKITKDNKIFNEKLAKKVVKDQQNTSAKLEEAIQQKEDVKKQIKDQQATTRMQGDLQHLNK